MYQTILCAIESTDEGKKVLEQALVLADKFDSNLYVVNVLPYTLLPKDYQNELKEKAIPAFQAIVEGIPFSQKQMMVKIGKPYLVICDEANRVGADLIVMGTHSQKGMTAMLGSTANGVANNAQCDVTLVKI